MIKQIYTINASLSSVLPLTGIGEEHLIDIVSGEVIARFWNGNLMVAYTPILAEGETLVIDDEAV